MVELVGIDNPKNGGARLNRKPMFSLNENLMFLPVNISPEVMLKLIIPTALNKTVIP